MNQNNGLDQPGMEIPTISAAFLLKKLDMVFEGYGWQGGKLVPGVYPIEVRIRAVHSQLEWYQKQRRIEDEDVVVKYVHARLELLKRSLK
jgi:hypothetical protein